MKLLSLLLISMVIMISCTKETLAPVTRINETIDTSAMLKYSGNFMNGPYGMIAGKGQVYRKNDGSYVVILNNFNTDNGPDLYVYLSKEIMPVNFIDLGKLKSTNGNQTYDLQGMINFSEYKYICIHCKQYNHLFGYAPLQ